MATEAFIPTAAASSGPFGYSQMQMLQNSQTAFLDSSTQNVVSDRHGHGSVSPTASAILMRKLPLQTSKGSLESMLLFAKDFLSADFVETKDNGYLTALARFSTSSAAQEARAMLNGKPNTTREANMIVEVIPPSPESSSTGRRNTEHRVTMSPNSASVSAGPQLTRQTSRFNGTFQDVISPGSTVPHKGDMSKADAHQGYFLTQSPIGQPLERQRVSGKSVIGEDGVDDDTGKLLNDPVGYAQNDLAGGLNSTMAAQPRRSTLPQLPTARFGALSINSSGMTSPAVAGIVSPRVGSVASPTAFSPANMASMGPNASYQFSNQHFMRPNFPPINPSDQNPPCNTLYVGNLPMDASEDELKAMFSKQRGYKRLCLRTKQNGPMCFVEFEDIPAASKALTECYGLPLHNSTKGGIRLSFSKNPLGVRTGQSGSLGMPSPLSPQGPMSGMNNASGMQPFSSVNGPPPGLAAPPGFLSINTTNGGPMNGLASPMNVSVNNGFAGPLSPIGTSSAGMSGMMSPSAMGNGGWPRDRSQLPAYMMGR